MRSRGLLGAVDAPAAMDLSSHYGYIILSVKI